MQQTIKAKVSERLLTKASRLFTGTLDGRIIEILQNARRAGATEVNIINKDGTVTINDNGSGIDDFTKLLHLGDSDWDDVMEQSEDPAGVGVFCLAPREVTICSGNRKICITEKAWTGHPIAVLGNAAFIKGTTLVFKDEPWDLKAVEKQAVFSGMNVIVDGRRCAKENFCSEYAVDYPALGCMIEVRLKTNLNKWHTDSRYGHYCDNVLVNFHGQVVSFKDSPVSDTDLSFLVDMTGESTGIRLMLPARTQLIENNAFERLKAAIEIEAYRFILKQGSHKLPFKEYERAKELGVKLPEAEPVFYISLLRNDSPEPIRVMKPDDLPLSKCYRFGKNCEDNCETDEANSHILAALGKFKEPFVPVSISHFYDGYSWADIPVISKVEVTVGKELGRQYIYSETLIAADNLQITVHTSDKKVFRSDVLMAVVEDHQEDKNYSYINVYVTPEAREQLCATDIWYHLGGWNDDGDTYDTQLYYFEQDLETFWAGIIGPAEYLRSKIRECLCGIVKDWKKVIFEKDGTLTIFNKDGTETIYESPGKNSTAT
ncbi:MAG: hypothetical protein FVQ82_17290 [Planctomycetes bacterium]|nr:hypothetical protein [Planctomycetota bacterium]